MSLGNQEERLSKPIEDIVLFEEKRVQVIEGMDQRVIRGISDNEATIILKHHPEYALNFQKLKPGIGRGFLHASKHAHEDEEFNQSIEEFKNALNQVLKSRVPLSSRGTNLYLVPLNEEKQTYMLAITYTDEIIKREVLITGYSARCDTKEKNITTTFEGMVKSGDVPILLCPESEKGNCMIELYTNDELAVILTYTGKDARIHVQSSIHDRGQWERDKSGLFVPKSNNQRNKFIKGIEKREKIVELYQLNTFLKQYAA